MTLFWAKTTPEGKPGISVFEHMVNVGCVAKAIAEISPNLLKLFKLQASIVGALAALHDLGKISPGFQRKCEIWLKENQLITIDRNGCWDTSMEPDHGQISHAAIQAFLLENGINRKSAKYLSTVLGAHHGNLKSRPRDLIYQPKGSIIEPYSKIDWHTERMACAQNVWTYFLNDEVCGLFNAESPSLWWLAGLASVADWIGSDEQFFPSCNDGKQIHKHESAVNALREIGFRKTNYVTDLSFHDLFHDLEKPEVIWIPNDMQKKTHAMICDPGVYVVEAPMGMGKTEAALWAAYHLLISGSATGIYFALPTQATSNRIHIRINDFLRRIAPKAATSRLIHGNSWLMADDCGIRPAATIQKSIPTKDARKGRDWFSSSKRALLAPFGVGTIDQALLGVVAAKHFFVRHFALAGKVVIIDEVHSYDLYTGTLVDKLITTLEGLGCTIIVLSATLTKKRRNQIVTAPKFDESESLPPYPLITGMTQGLPREPLPTKGPKEHTVKIRFLPKRRAVEAAVKTVQKGGTVLWVCNTVDSAQKQYQRLRKLSKNKFPVGLLHSRFPFWRRKELEDKWMERLGKDGQKRCASILVSTQVVEQSVDIDADLLISELAPTDMILQRIGRLWRHNRKWRPSVSAKLIIIDEAHSTEKFKAMEPETIIKALGKKSNVYAPFVLMRTLELWRKRDQLLLPTQIRELIEATYQERDNDSDSWKKLFCNWFGTGSAKKMVAARNCNLWQLQLRDEEGIQTRINESPTIPLVLCKNLEQQHAVFMDQAQINLDCDRFELTAAQAIHKNLVKVPDRYFIRSEPSPAFKYYLSGMYSIGLVDGRGAVKVEGLKVGITTSYSDELGLVIEEAP